MLKMNGAINFYSKWIVLVVILLVSDLSGQTVLYKPSTEVIANPGRGLYKYSITDEEYSSVVGYNNLAPAFLTEWKNSPDKITVVYRTFLLSSFIDKDINPVYLDNIRTDFDHVRQAGMKIIVRFSYSDTQDNAPQQPKKYRILSHISQLSSVLNQNKDVIFSVQAGFIGTWGEWYYTNSDEFGTQGIISPTQWANRKEVLDSLLAATHPDIALQVRTVAIKKYLYGDLPLTPATAYQSSPQARIGFYNDAFLNDWGDQGTFEVKEQCDNPLTTDDYEFLANESKYLPLSGETNGLNPCDGGLRTKGSNALFEMNDSHWSSINRDYHPAFWNNMDDSVYQEMLRSLGYCFVLIKSTVDVQQDNFNIELEIKNQGYARAFDRRPVFLVLENTENGQTTPIALNTDVRTWSWGTVIGHNISPGVSGTFRLYLWLPDKDSVLSKISDYSIRLANDSLWHPISGYNDLQQTIVLDKKSIVQNPNTSQSNLLYPNPVIEHLSIQTTDEAVHNISITNLVGQLVLQTNIIGADTIDVADLSAGIYFIKMNARYPVVLKFVKL
ncbi:MAG TPA: DUF4874 domain-containing protein [Saprospiraceae bacterium]|nr:DUF4874 domain-containing protein [Saprospiraceae bacterium]HMX85678.1 DUF4874 domain-containing protein [Saprospiraceae bacterium]HNA41492.1 DUF4874 domain-containing protein [Saprospiraceae bacterium]HNA94257.1 DUF4874 domain-containing protein [Saprospiraceae bacterium]HND15842.1 DUF4874 domain-containing protein [Saprospiraceae bacterium]